MEGARVATTRRRMKGLRITGGEATTPYGLEIPSNKAPTSYKQNLGGDISLLFGLLGIPVTR
jgi:hypothetical protein